MVLWGASLYGIALAVRYPALVTSVWSKLPGRGAKAERGEAVGDPEVTVELRYTA